MRLRQLLVGALAVVAMATAAQARDIRVAPAAPPSHPGHKMYEAFTKYLAEESGGALGATILGPEVVNIGSTKQALQSGVAEMGNFLPLYFASDVPNSALIGDLAFLGHNPHAMASAMTEYVVTCPDCLAEFKKAGLVFLGAGSSSPYVILTTKRVETAEDIKGLRLRSGGSPFSRFAEFVGASPVRVPVSETFESISQGVVDGTMASAFDLESYRLVDLIKYVTELPLGTYHATSNFTVGSRVWDTFSKEEREEIARAANRGNAFMTGLWGIDSPAKAREAGMAAGIEFIEPDPSLVVARNAFIEADLATLPKLAAEQYGIEDAVGKIARFRALVEKWEGLLQNAGDDPVKVAEIVQAEVWDKVDLASYGD